MVSHVTVLILTLLEVGSFVVLVAVALSTDTLIPHDIVFVQRDTIGKTHDTHGTILNLNIGNLSRLNETERRIQNEIN